MPFAENEQVRISYETSGAPSGEVLVLCNSLGSNMHMWDKVLPQLEVTCQVVRYDQRGHGRSSIPAGPYTIDHLGQDLTFLIDYLGVERANFCGLSLGGQVGMWLAIHGPQRVHRLIVANSGARIGTPEMWDQRVATVESSGMGTLAAATLERWFTPNYRLEHREEMDVIRNMIEATDSRGYINCCGVLRNTDLRADVALITAPALVIAGTHDPATPPSDARAIHACIRGSRYVELDASHLSAWERAQEFGEAVLPLMEERSNG